MSNEKQETVEDIVDDIRAQNQGLPEDSYALSPLVCDLLSLADRIEAATKRECDSTREKSSQVGNAAAMLEALVKADAAFSLIVKSAWFIDANFHEIMSLNKVMTAADAALAKAGGAS